MAILTASQDLLKYDPLKSNGIDGVDMIGKAASKRVKTYNEDLGYAVHPEEEDAAFAFKEGVDKSVNEQQDALTAYQKDFATALGNADTQAQGILGQHQSMPGQETIQITMLDRDGQPGKVYTVNKEWALSPDAAVIFRKTGANFIGDGTTYTVDGYRDDISEGEVIGRIENKTLSSILGQAQGQTRGVDDQLGDMNATIDSMRNETSAAIASGRNTAIANYDQQVSQAQTNIKTTQDMWLNYQSDQQKAFIAGVESNTGGIRDLVESGALVMSGTIS